ncbi:MAG: sulfatase-like hydrolase/transferase [Planctomycetaceae bacterium]|nr:sulfatase-like hydrolase/transferase [Planctomycetaceae bacterium]
MIRHTTASCLLVAGALTGQAAVACEDRPNILLIVADDQRPDTIHALGNEMIRTPNLDRLVREGTAFTRAVTAIPICVASRAELLTGRNGLKNGRADFGFTPADDAKCLAELLSEAGYDTCYTGKWHTSGRPSSRGYEQSVGLFAGGGEALPLSHPADWHGRRVTGYVGWVFQTDDRQLFPERGVGLTPGISEVFADEALRFLKAPRERPFFLHLNFTAPHDPLHVPPGEQFRYAVGDMRLPPNFAPQHPFDHGNAGMRDELLFQLPRTPEETCGELAVYYALISHMDAQIGRVLDRLEQSGMLDNTVVVFTSDHGLAIGSHGLRGKQNMYEHTIGVPLLMRGPGVPAGLRSAAACYLRDLYPTVCEFAGVQIADPVDGRSLGPVLRGETAGIHADIITHFRDVQRAIRTDRWKYIAYPQAQREQLFDLQDDPLERHDRSADPAQRENLTQLRARLEAQLSR